MSLPGIDHPLILLRDIEAGRAFYARLGFTLTPVGLHPWGTSTSLAVLERSALELMSVYDDTLLDTYGTGDFCFGRHMHDALSEREGLSLVALHSTDAAGDRAAMEARGAVFQGHIGFRRKVKVPGMDWDEAVVSLEISRDPALPRVSHFLAQQHKPHLLWRPEWMRHANGAKHIAAVTYRAPDAGPVLARLGAMFGADRVAEAPGGWHVATGQGDFRVLRPDGWGEALGDAPAPEIGAQEAAGVAIDVAVTDLAAVKALLVQAGIPAMESQGALAVADTVACGNVLIRFVSVG